MSTEILTGEAAASASVDNDFAGLGINRDPRHAKLAESTLDRAHTLLENAFSGRWGADKKLAEAFATSDLTMGIFAVIDKEFVNTYSRIPSTWRSYTSVTKVSDFRPKRLIDRRMGSIGFERVPELTEYPAGKLGDWSQYAITVAKFGRRYALSWEMWLNNEAVQELMDFPTLLAEQAVETEAINAVSNLLKINPATGRATDVNTDFFKKRTGTGAVDNSPDNKPLTYDNLKAALQKIKLMKDASGRPVVAPRVKLVVPVALEDTANGIKSIQQRELVDGSGNKVIMGNELSSVDVVVEPMLDAINDHAKAATTWFLVPDPNSPRKALWAAFLLGHETPDIRVKADQGNAVGGGALSITDGSFELDDIQYRGRHVVGNQTGDPAGTYVSYGA